MNRYNYLDDDDDFYDEVSDTQIRKSIASKYAAEKQWSDDSQRQQITESNKERWSDASLLSKHSIIISSRWNDEEYHERVTTAIRQAVSTEEWSNNQQKGLEEFWNSELGNKQKELVTGKGNPRYLGTTVGINIKTGERVEFNGNKEMEDAGFSQSKINLCINGHRKSHKGYTWKREPK
jgi:hypothetical protein